MTRPIEITYEHKTFLGNWRRYQYAVWDGKEYERVINIIHQNPDEYRIISVRHMTE